MKRKIAEEEDKQKKLQEKQQGIIEPIVFNKYGLENEPHLIYY